VQMLTETYFGVGVADRTAATEEEE
jgi:hypothetical protein